MLLKAKVAIKATKLADYGAEYRKYKPPISIKPPQKNTYKLGYFINETATNCLFTYSLTRLQWPAQPVLVKSNRTLRFECQHLLDAQPLRPTANNQLDSVLWQIFSKS